MRLVQILLGIGGGSRTVPDDFTEDGCRPYPTWRSSREGFVVFDDVPGELRQ